MLERATACLKAGARDSLRCAKNAPRSQRMLHSTFWTHGAGDLDLPPWAISVLPPPDLHLKHDSTSTKKSSTRVDNHSPSDAPFLDFLYPPQALAWLHRANGQHWERWEKRNARRLPEGFIQASRGYSSRSRGKDVSDNAYAPIESEEEHVERKDSDGIDGSQENNTSELAEAPLPRLAADRGYSVSDSSGETSKQPSDTPKEDMEHREQQYGHSPGELAEQDADEQSLSPTVDPLAELRKLLRRGRSKSEQDVAQDAWHLYNSLEEDDKRNILLKKELLFWLNSHADTVASANCISLFWSLPLQERTLEVYEAVLPSFLRRRDHDSAMALHREALSNIPNGSEVTKLLFRFYMRIKLWGRAHLVKQEYDDYFATSSGTQHEALFWYHVGEMSDLKDVTYHFIKHIQKLPYKGPESVYHSFAIRLVEESILQLSREGVKIPSRRDFKEHKALTVLRWFNMVDSNRVRVLVDYLVLWSPKVKTVLENALPSLLQRHERTSQYWYVHLMASHMYAKLCEQPDTTPSRDVLKLFVERLRRLRTSTFPVEGGLDLPTILNDWQRYHGVLDLDMLEKILKTFAFEGDHQNIEKYAEYLKTEYPQWTDRSQISWTLVYVHAVSTQVSSAVAAFEEIEKEARSNDDQPTLGTWNSLFLAHRRANDLDGALKYLHKFHATGLELSKEIAQPIADLLSDRGDVNAVEDLIQQMSVILPGTPLPYLVSSHLKALVKAMRFDRAEEVLNEQVQVTPLDRRAELTASCNIVLSAYAGDPNIDATMRIYRLMKSSNVPLNGGSYAALMRALALYRQTAAAKRILTHIMPREGLRGTASHYAIIIEGFTHERNYIGAVAWHRRMKMAGVSPTAATQRAYLKAKNIYNSTRLGRYEHSDAEWKRHEPEPLEPLEEIRKAMESLDLSTLGVKGMAWGTDDSTAATRLSKVADHAMELYASANQLEKVEELFGVYQSEVQRKGIVSVHPPMRLLTALMNAHFHARNFDMVEKYWKMAKSQADMMASATTLPDIRRAHDTASNLAITAESAPPTSEMPTALAETHSAEVGFASTETAVAPTAPIVLPKSHSFQGPRPAPGQAHMLTRPARIYFRTLLLQARTSTMIKTATQLLNQGYRLDVVAWNRFIEYLCHVPESPILLAFILTERYLMPGFPGWLRKRRLRPARRTQRLRSVDYMKIRYEHRSLLVPHYRTLLYLGKVLKDLEKKETMHGTLREEELRGMKALRGTVRQIMERAPKTVEALETMPYVAEDWFQARILRGEGLYPYGEARRYVV